jgi:hypothetical protein
MKVENCSNCKRVIGKLEQAYVFHGNVVCQNCYQRLTDAESKQAQASVKKPVKVKVESIPPQTKQEKLKHKIAKIIVTVIFIASYILFFTYYIYQKFKLPALSAQDVKLIEELVYEMNLLDASKFSDNRTFEAQLTKFDAAYRNFSDLASSNYYMATMGILALEVSLNYSLVRPSFIDVNAEEYESYLDHASKSRKNLVKAYRLLQDRATISEFNKFPIEDCGWEIEQREEATSK